MSASKIDAAVLLFPNQDIQNHLSDAQLNADVRQLQPNISFAQSLTDGLQTLSTRNAALDGTVNGFLYVPDLPPSDPCYNISQQYVPSNVTRQANLPQTDFTLIAIAPWISAACSLAYISAASQDPARALIFYPPNNQTIQPPDPSSYFWSLGNGQSLSTLYQYPIYAIPGFQGNNFMHQLALYSGSIINVPYGHEILQLAGVDPRDFVRIYSVITVVQTSALPNLWLFLVVVLAVLVAVLAIMSGVMHLIQRYRRHSLRRRVVRGEVNLEALGIKHLTVPQEHIQRLPLFTYSAEDEKSAMTAPRRPSDNTVGPSEYDEVSAVDPRPASTSSDHAAAEQVFVIDDTKSNHDSVIIHRFLPYSQPTCAICLEDYVSGETEIRELPCGHIFHPECIDQFLGNNSSLCPLCKKSCLPVGYCPVEITNAMVVRERNLQHLRSQVTVAHPENAADLEASAGRRRVHSLGSNIKRVVKRSSHAGSTSTAVPMTPQRAYMTPARVGQGDSSVPALSRDEIVAQRIRDLAAANAESTPAEAEAVEAGPRPLWRRTVAHVFPGF